MIQVVGRIIPEDGFSNPSKFLDGLENPSSFLLDLLLTIMASRILVSTDPYETRIAVLENEQLVEIFVDPVEKKRLVGNIYNGRVASVIPGLEAAFVDIGLGRNAFLHVHDLAPRPEGQWEFKGLASDDGGGEDEDEDGDGVEDTRPTTPEIQIHDYISEGQTVLVQMEKEPLGQKGCRITAHISLPGRYLVFFPTSNHVAISRRIESEEERERLTEVGRELSGAEHGLIMRTAAAGVSAEELGNEFAALKERWNVIALEASESPVPTLVYEDEGLLYQIVRDYLLPTTEEILVEGEEVYDHLRTHVGELLPEMVPRVHLYGETLPLFRVKGIEAEIERLLQRRVWLKSGGYLVLDETEALTVVDVNTGRDLGRSNLEETAFYTNLEATREIARQLRLRDIGGIIIIDFIDMLSPNNQRLVMEQFKASIASDRSHPTLFSMTELGLVQLTRKRVRKSLLKGMTGSCPYCRGEGIIFSEATMVTRILRRVEELLMEDPRDALTIHVHPHLAEEIHANWSERLEEICSQYGARVSVVAQSGLHIQEIRDSFAEKG